jgi:hypothetical protein
MTPTDIKKLVDNFLKEGGEIEKVTMSEKTFKTFRGKSGSYNQGAKKVSLRDKSYT